MLLSPLAFVYALGVGVKRKRALKRLWKPAVPVISVGNLILGGSGKTPLTKAIFNEFGAEMRVFIVLRGYKRQSKGLVLVCEDGEIKCDVKTSGDEAMEYATTLPGANVIVAENRRDGINEAIRRGARLVILDDGFGKFDIFKFEILLRPSREPALNLTIPSGAYRYPKSFYALADFIPGEGDVIKTSHIDGEREKMALVTGIANPWRLKEYFARCATCAFFPDHYNFSREELAAVLANSGADSLLVTQKDYVKISKFELPISVIVLDTKIGEKFRAKIAEFIQNYNQI